jgi:CelD/BcsL family acetyltransferase involved in cellulose biosynthesis
MPDLRARARSGRDHGDEPVAEVTHDIEALASPWEELADRTGAPPFMRPGWMAAWSKAFGTGTPLIVTVRHKGRLTGVLPLERRSGALYALANHHSPLYRPVAQDATTVRALADRALGEVSRRLELFLVDDQHDLTAAMLEALVTTGCRSHTRIVRRTPFLIPDAGWEGVLSSLSRQDRKELRRRRRRLEEVGPVELETIRDRAGLERTFDELLVLEDSGWKAARGTAIASQPETREFYREVATWAADRGLLMLFFLTVGGRRIAVDLCLEAAGVRYMLKGGFDPEFASVSPGNVLLEANLAHGVESGLKRIELGGGSDAYKLRWTRATHPFSEVQIFSPSAAGRGAWLVQAHALPAARRLRDRWR